MSTAEKFEQLQQKLFDAPEYLGLADGHRIACKRFLVLLAADAPESNELEAAYDAAVYEARSLVTNGLLSGFDLSDLELEPTDAAAPSTKPEEDVADVTLDESSDDPSAPSAPPVPSAPPATLHFPERKFHAVANIFPMMSAADLAKLAEDIKENGLREPIWLHGGKIIDGRNRYRACKLAGVEPTFREWDANGSLVMFALSVNLHRRHLNDQQRAVVAAKAKPAFEAEAIERRNANLLQNKGATDGRNSAHRCQGRSAEQAAAMLDVSVDSAKKASTILKAGAPELVAAVEQGMVGLDAVATVSKLPHHEQKKLVEGGTVKTAAAKMRKAKVAKPTHDTAIVSEAMKTICRELGPLPQLYLHFMETRVWEATGHDAWEDFCPAELRVRPEFFAGLLALCDP